MFLEANWRPARRYGIVGNGCPHGRCSIPGDGKITTSKRRKLPNRRSCFLFRIKGEAVGMPSVSHDAISAGLDDRLAARTEFQCKEILADRPPAD